jgi:hypothetical protein
MGVRRFVAILFVGMAAGCAGAGPMLGPGNSADLGFSKPAASGFQGRFTKLDGRAIPNGPTVIRVPSGRHTIEYTCPDVLTLDTYPTVRAEFTAGRSYALECGANAPGVVRDLAVRPPS